MAAQKLDWNVHTTRTTTHWTQLHSHI